VCSGTASVKSNIQNRHIVRTDEPRVLKLLQLLFECFQRRLHSRLLAYRSTFWLPSSEGSDCWRRANDRPHQERPLMRNSPSPSRRMPRNRRWVIADFVVGIFRPRMRTSKDCLATAATLKRFKNGAPQNISYVRIPINAFVFSSSHQLVLSLAPTPIAVDTFKGNLGLVSHASALYTDPYSEDRAFHGRIRGFATEYKTSVKKFTAT
jgi:hypothetical protein